MPMSNEAATADLEAAPLAHDGPGRCIGLIDWLARRKPGAGLREARKTWLLINRTTSL